MECLEGKEFSYNICFDFTLATSGIIFFEDPNCVKVSAN